MTESVVELMQINPVFAQMVKFAADEKNSMKSFNRGVNNTQKRGNAMHKIKNASNALHKNTSPRERNSTYIPLSNVQALNFFL